MKKLNGKGITDLPLLRTLLAICQKSWEPSFWEGMDGLVLLAYTSLAVSSTFLQQLLACLSVTLDSTDSVGANEKSEFYELWQRKLKTMKMSEAWPDVRINSNLNLLTKYTCCRRSTEFKDIFPWNISQIIMKTVSISMRIAIIYMMKQGIPFWVWWKVNGNWNNNMIRISQTSKTMSHSHESKDCESDSQGSK